MGGKLGGTSGSLHGLGYLFRALRREGLIADEDRGSYRAPFDLRFCGLGAIGFFAERERLLVVTEFPSRAAAEGWYRSAEYQQSNLPEAEQFCRRFDHR